MAILIVETRMGADVAGACVVFGSLREMLQSEFATGALQDSKIAPELCIAVDKVCCVAQNSWDWKCAVCFNTLVFSDRVDPRGF